MENRTEENIQLGHRIKMIRKKLGLTLKEFGEKMTPEASESIVSRWERGINKPNSVRLITIANLGECSTTYLLTGVKTYRDLSNEEKELMAKEFNVNRFKKNREMRETLEDQYANIDFQNIDAREILFLNESMKFISDYEIEQVEEMFLIMRSLREIKERRKEGLINNLQLQKERDGMVEALNNIINQIK